MSTKRSMLDKVDEFIFTDTFSEKFSVSVAHTSNKKYVCSIWSIRIISKADVAVKCFQRHTMLQTMVCVLVRYKLLAKFMVYRTVYTDIFPVSLHHKYALPCKSSTFTSNLMRSWTSFRLKRTTVSTVVPLGRESTNE